jgi:hypothetical protein
LERFNGAALDSGGNTRTGVPYEFSAPADIRKVLVDGKVVYFSSKWWAVKAPVQMHHGAEQSE